MHEARSPGVFRSTTAPSGRQARAMSACFEAAALDAPAGQASNAPRDADSVPECRQRTVIGAPRSRKRKDATRGGMPNSVGLGMRVPGGELAFNRFQSRGGRSPDSKGSARVSNLFKERLSGGRRQALPEEPSRSSTEGLRHRNDSPPLFRRSLKRFETRADPFESGDRPPRDWKRLNANSPPGTRMPRPTEFGIPPRVASFLLRDRGAPMTVLVDAREPNPHPWERYLPARLEHRARLPRNRPTSPWPACLRERSLNGRLPAILPRASAPGVRDLNARGPTYNAQSCRECHQNVVTGGASQVAEHRTGQLVGDAFAETLEAH